MGIGGSKHTMKDFDDKVVVVTGGSRGIGLEFSKLAAGEGAKVAIIARDQARIGTACGGVLFDRCEDERALFLC
jgi:NAD(P)-dependent dehydrogenase (short-subunit alcohol dehydrogenase family)